MLKLIVGLNFEWGSKIKHMMCSEFLTALARKNQVLKTLGLLSERDFNEIKRERMCKFD